MYSMERDVYAVRNTLATANCRVAALKSLVGSVWFSWVQEKHERGGITGSALRSRDAHALPYLQVI